MRYPVLCVATGAGTPQLDQFSASSPAQTRKSLVGNGIGRERLPAVERIVDPLKQQGTDEADDAGLTNWSFGH
jgi:hypothetical protein